MDLELTSLQRLICHKVQPQQPVNQPSLSPCTSFFTLSIRFGLSVMLFQLPYLAPKLLSFLWIRFLICIRVFSTDLLVEFYFIIWKVLFCLYCLMLFWYPLGFPRFTSIFWFTSSSCIIRLVHCSLYNVIVYSSLRYSFCLFS